MTPARGRARGSAQGEARGGMSPQGPLARFVGAGLMALYRLFGRAVTPALALVFARRARRGKEDPARRGERFGHPSRPRPDGPLVWLHAASVGETNAAEPLVAALVSRGLGVLLTTGTVTSARLVASRAPAGVVHQFVPYDTPAGLSRFLDHWRPDLAITLESEIWPTTVWTLARRAIPLVVASATLSERSAAGWARLPALAGQIFPRLTLCLAQTEADAARLARFGAPRVVVAGNLKYDSRSLPADPVALAALAEAIGERPLWLAASTHDGEEAIAAGVHAGLVARGLDRLLTVIVPRHPERGAAIAADLSARGLAVARRSEGALPGPHTDIYLADTIGELGLFYRLSPVAFIGKSLVPEGGQNPLEAARLATAVVTGPHVFNLADIYQPLIEAGGALVVTDAAALEAAVARLLGDPDEARRLTRTAGAVARAGEGALAATLQALEPLLPPARPAATGAFAAPREPGA